MLLLACSSQDPTDKPDDGGAQEAGSKAPGNLPNLSTAGRQASAGAGGGEQLPEQCKFSELGPCVSSALDQAVECLSAGRVGVFAEDRAACTFSEAGASVQFSEPVRRGSKGVRVSFELKVGDRTCLRFSHQDAEAPFIERYQLDSTDHAVDYLHGFERRLQCDGVSHDFKGTDLTSCPATKPLELPMPRITEDPNQLIFEFSRPGRISRVFMCTSQ